MTRALRVAGAAALLVGAVVHAAQLVSIFHAVPWVGPLFGRAICAHSTMRWPTWDGGRSWAATVRARRQSPAKA